MKSDTAIIEEVRQGLEIIVAEMREVRLEAALEQGKPWIKMEASTEGPTSRFDALHAYLSLKILERLESIDDTLITMLSHFGK